MLAAKTANGKAIMAPRDQRQPMDETKRSAINAFEACEGGELEGFVAADRRFPDELFHSRGDILGVTFEGAPWMFG